MYLGGLHNLGIYFKLLHTKETYKYKPVPWKAQLSLMQQVEDTFNLEFSGNLTEVSVTADLLKAKQMLK